MTECGLSDTQMAHRTLQLGMAQQKMEAPEVLGAPVDEGHFVRRPHGAVGGRVQANLARHLLRGTGRRRRWLSGNDKIQTS